MRLALLITPLALLTTFAQPQDTIALRNDKENVVASRIEGSWILDEPDTHRIGGDKSITNLAFTRDDKAAAQVPPKHAELFAEGLYLAGEAQLARDRFPFAITTAHGNPRLVIFRPSAGDPHGAPQSFNVMLCPAMERAKDRLFLGGEKNDRPFAVFVRKNIASTKGG